MNPLLKDLFRRFVRYLLDIHPPFRTIHNHVLPPGPVQEDRQIELFYRIGPRIIYVLRDQYLIDLFPRRPGLDRYQRAPQYPAGDLPDLLRTLPNCYATLVRSLNRTLPPTTRMDLSLHYREAITELDLQILIRFLRRSCVIHGNAFLYGYLIFL